MALELFADGFNNGGKNRKLAERHLRCFLEWELEKPGHRAIVITKNKCGNPDSFNDGRQGKRAASKLNEALQMMLLTAFYGDDPIKENSYAKIGSTSDPLNRHPYRDLLLSVGLYMSIREKRDMVDFTRRDKNIVKNTLLTIQEKLYALFYSALIQLRKKKLMCSDKMYCGLVGLKFTITPKPSGGRDMVIERVRPREVDPCNPRCLIIGTQTIDAAWCSLDEPVPSVPEMILDGSAYADDVILDVFQIDELNCIREEILTKMGCDSLCAVFRRGLETQFFSEQNELTWKRMGIEYIEGCYTGCKSEIDDFDELVKMAIEKGFVYPSTAFLIGQSKDRLLFLLLQRFFYLLREWCLNRWKKHNPPRHGFGDNRYYAPDELLSVTGLVDEYAWRLSGSFRRNHPLLYEGMQAGNVPLLPEVSSATQMASNVNTPTV